MGTNLSRRELEVARLVGEGLTNREIATRLFISERTVDGHLEHIREKLGVSNRAQVTAWIVRQDAAVVPAAEPPPTPRRWTMAHPRVWMAGALVLALLAVGAGLLRLTEPSPPIIETIAGSRCVVQHYPGGCFGGDSFLAINAGLARPSALAIDGHGRLYIADYNNYRIRMVDTKGVITTVAGDPRKPRLTENAYATLVDIGNASSIAVDNQGELLVLTVVTDDLELWRVDGAGFFHQMASLGHTNAGQSGLINMPVGGLAVAQDGTIFIADRDGNRVLRLPPGGTLQKFAGTGEF
ncbi:MAG TPA: LuxR C-terminal-related transcriptional regulator, partial [Candidatus Dormibacteraeota bacterium]|nr:LuxR C-terminal-related transcriptional regulator [Candidatus Dormibacteraeota bacterium]